MKIFNFLLVLVTLSMMFMASCSDDPEKTPEKCGDAKVASCAAEKQICDGQTGECLDLCASVNCNAETEVCDWQLGTCVAKGDLCATDTTCAAQNKVCDDSTGVIVCKNDCTVSGCPTGETCNTTTKLCGNLCEDVTCCEGKTCNPANGQCEGTCTSISTITAVRSEGIAVSDPNSATPSIGDVTDIEGVVVAVLGIKTGNKHGMFIRQANANEFAGIYIDFYTVKADAAFVTPVLGDLVKISGKHNEYHGFSKITPATVDQVVVVSNNVTVPAPIDITVAQLEEKYESMLVNLTGGPFTVTVEANTENYYNTTLKNAANQEFQMKSDIHYPKYVLPIGTVLTKATGVITFDYGYFKLLPRNAADLGQVDKCAGVTCTETQYCDALTGACVEKVAENTAELCSDGISNDGDRYIDCDDYDCAAFCGATCDPACETGFTCQNGTCVAVGTENTDALCHDGVSNDGDNYIDCDDFDCTPFCTATCDPVCTTGFTCQNGTCVADAVVENGTISQIRQAQNNIIVGDTVKTTGTVMSVVYSTTTPTNVKGIYIQESANDFGGIYIYVNPASAITIANGDNVEVTAKVTDYHGWMELDTTADKIVVGTHGNTLFTAKNAAVTALGEANESMLVNMTGGPFTVTEVGVAGNNYNTKLADASGNVLVMRSTIYRFNEAAGFAVGTVYSTIKGIVTQYDTVYSVQPRNADDLVVTGQVTCDPACSEWENCIATDTCKVKDGRCNTNTDCTVAGQECNLANNTCEVPPLVCNPVCDEWETCTAGTPNSCILSTGRCEADTDCTGGATCNTTTHRCAGGANPQFANADFSTWTSDTAPESWTTGNFVATFSKVTRSGTDYALNMTGTSTANGYILSSILTAVTDTKPVSITFEMNGSGKMSINIACDLNNDTFTTGEQKFYNLTGETFANVATNAYNTFNTNSEWKTFTITTGAELNDFWKSGTNCRLEIKAGKTDPFDASIDNVVINY